MKTKKDTAKLYREAAVRGASPVGLVIILYEEALRALRRAEAAMERGEVEERSLAISHALRVIGYLQSVLDFERGGRLAHQLSSFYDYSKRRMLEANAKNSAEILGRLIKDFTDSTEAWREVERTLAGPSQATETAPGVRAARRPQDQPEEAIRRWCA